MLLLMWDLSSRTAKGRSIEADFTYVDTVALARVLLAGTEPFQAGYRCKSFEYFPGKSSPRS